jgi:hypothetical protein
MPDCNFKTHTFFHFLCLGSHGGEGGWSECQWSVGLKRCISPSYVPIKCLGGICGTLLSGSNGQCPSLCTFNTECKSCLQHTTCGWCSLDSNQLSGMGACVEGTLEGKKFDKYFYLI